MATTGGFFNNLVDTALSYLPSDTARHLVNSQKELLMAARSVLDEQIKWSDIHIARAEEKRHSRRSVEPTEESLDTAL